MNSRSAILCAAPLLLIASQARAENQLRDLCTDRPGLGTPACTMDPGHVAFELGLGDWTHDRQSGSVEDDFTTGDALLRVGLTSSLEAQLGWTAYTHVRIRTGNLVERQGGIGDVTLALRQNLSHPDGSGFSAALMPYATLPTSSHGVGQQDWSAGLLVPLSYQLHGGVQLAFTGEVDAAVDADGDGRHLAYSGVVGVDLPITQKIDATLEIDAARDEDPSGHSTQLLGGLSAAWQANDNLQFDVGSAFGLNHDAPDAELYFGVVKRF